jgi:hypothetical protein
MFFFNIYVEVVLSDFILLRQSALGLPIRMHKREAAMQTMAGVRGSASKVIMAEEFLCAFAVSMFSMDFGLASNFNGHIL